MPDMNKLLWNSKDVCEVLGCGRTKACEVIKSLNTELSDKGFMVYRGKVSRVYFLERYFPEYTKGV